MLSTREIIAVIKEDYAQNVSVTKLVRYLDRVQRQIFSDDNYFCSFMNPADPNFPYPILTTQDGTLEYEMVDGALVDSLGVQLSFELQGRPVVAQRVNRVLRDLYHTQHYGQRNSGYGLRRRSAIPDGDDVLGNRQMERISVRTIPRTPTEPARIIFNENPGDADFYLDVVLAPRKIGTLDTEMSLDTDLWEMELIDGVRGHVENAINGESKVYQTFINEHVPRIRGTLNDDVEQSDPIQVLPRKFG